MNFEYKKKSYKVVRFPKSTNRSLQAWSAADEYLLRYFERIILTSESIGIYNDRFGFLTCILNQYSSNTIISYKSQDKSCRMNLKLNDLEIFEDRFTTPLSKQLSPMKVVLIKIPKSIELFRLYLDHISLNSQKEIIVVCSFMTKHFTKQMLSVAGEYFEEVEQSIAWKKSRLIILNKKKRINKVEILNSVKLNDSKLLKQYFGVFSSNRVDFATQYLIEHLEVKDEENTILDLASGNGIIAYCIRENKSDCKIHLLDDSFLAIESSKINLQDANTFFHYNDNLEDFENNFFDLVVSNPPFHFEYENNIEISIKLFNEVQRCLKDKGRFLLVSSKHLNFKTHLVKIFEKVKVITENKKFEIFECGK